jgi:hypothetical protein
MWSVGGEESIDMRDGNMGGKNLENAGKTDFFLMSSIEFLGV